jgi:hypothetical protein
MEHTPGRRAESVLGLGTQRKIFVLRYIFMQSLCEPRAGLTNLVLSGCSTFSLNT